MNPELSKKLLNLPLIDDFCCNLKFDTSLPEAIPGPKLLFPISHTQKLSEARINHLNTLTKPDIFVPMNMNINIELLHLLDTKASDIDLELNSEEEDILEIARKKPDDSILREKLTLSTSHKNEDSSYKLISEKEESQLKQNTNFGEPKSSLLQPQLKIANTNQTNAFLYDEDAIRDKISFKEKIKQNLQNLLNKGFSDNQALVANQLKNISQIFKLELSNLDFAKGQNLVECVFYNRAAYQKNFLPDLVLISKNQNNQKVLNMFKKIPEDSSKFQKYKETTVLVAAQSEKRVFLSDINCLYLDANQNGCFKIFSVFNSIYATKDNKNFDPLIVGRENLDLAKNEKDASPKEERLALEKESFSDKDEQSEHGMDIESRDSLDELL